MKVVLFPNIEEEGAGIRFRWTTHQTSRALLKHTRELAVLSVFLGTIHIQFVWNFYGMSKK
jgi:hypothetical protein